MFLTSVTSICNSYGDFPNYKMWINLEYPNGKWNNVFDEKKVNMPALYMTPTSVK